MNKVIYKCFICNQDFQHNHGVYEGAPRKTYGFISCLRCYEFNWDGWAPGYEKKILQYMEDNGIDPPKRNEKGWLPRDS